MNVTALVMCGGRGERLGPLGEVLSKNLLPVDGVPVVVHAVRLALERFEASRCVLLTAHLGDQVEFVVRRYFPGQRFEFVSDNDGQGTARAVRRVVGSLHGASLLYAHGNILVGEAGVKALSDQHQRTGAAWAISSTPVAPTHPRLAVTSGSAAHPALVVQLDQHAPWFSVGLGIAPEAVWREAAERRPEPGETVESWLFRRRDATRSIAAVDIGSQWSHVEDLASYESVSGLAAVGAARSPRPENSSRALLSPATLLRSSAG